MLLFLARYGVTDGLGLSMFNCHTPCKNGWYWAISSSSTPLKMQAANPGVLAHTNWLLNTCISEQGLEAGDEILPHETLPYHCHPGMLQI